MTNLASASKASCSVSSVDPASTTIISISTPLCFADESDPIVWFNVEPALRVGMMTDNFIPVCF